MTILSKKYIPFLNRLTAFLLVIIFGVVAFPHHSGAHAILIKANPAPDSQFIHSPHSIVLTFNERLEKELYYIKVFDAEGNNVTVHATSMSLDQHQLTLLLPTLKNGVYTVSYHVISADGHPVGSSYPMTIGKTSLQKSVQTATSPSNAHGGISFVLLNAFYYFALLSVIGMTFWAYIIRYINLQFPKEFSFWFKSLNGLLILTLLGISYLNISIGIGDFSLDHMYLLLFETTTGITAIILTTVSVIGYFLLRKTIWFDCVWITTACLTEAINGHAAVFHPVVYTVALDTMHLFTAGIWVGGLVIVLLYFGSDREHAWTFTALFSKGALISLLVLIITGTLSAIAFLPTLKDLFLSTWGWLLIIKVSLVIIVFIIAAFLRKLLKVKRTATFKQLLLGDVAAMALIITIVGALTDISPLPANQTFDVTGTTHGFSTNLDIQPRNPGTENVFTLYISHKGTAPKDVTLMLIYKGEKKLSPISVPIKLNDSKSSEHTYAYTANGPYIPIPGQYNVQIQITDRTDTAHVINNPMIVYPTPIIK